MLYKETLFDDLTIKILIIFIFITYNVSLIGYLRIFQLQFNYIILVLSSWEFKAKNLTRKGAQFVNFKSY